MDPIVVRAIDHGAACSQTGMHVRQALRTVSPLYLHIVTLSASCGSQVAVALFRSTFNQARGACDTGRSGTGALE